MSPGDAHWLEGVFLVVMTAATLIAMRRDVPWQNVLLVAGLILGVSAGLEWLIGKQRVAFGWLVVVPNGRGVARLLLRGQRAHSYYGWLVISVALLLIVSFGLALEPWLVANGNSVSWNERFGRVFTAFVLLVITTPPMIRKRPGPVPENFAYLYLWTLLSGALAFANGFIGAWPAVALVICSLGLIFSLIWGRPVKQT